MASSLSRSSSSPPSMASTTTANGSSSSSSSSVNDYEYDCNNPAATSDSSAEDEEFRRAQEMALAVAALGSSSKPMTATDIRMAVADVISSGETTVGKNDNEQQTNLQKQRYAEAQQRQRQLQLQQQQQQQEQEKQRKTSMLEKQQEKKSHEQLQNDKKKLLVERAQPIKPRDDKKDAILQYMFPSLWKEILDSVEGQALRGQNLIFTLGIINCCVLYLAIAPPSSSLIYRVVNALFVVNMTVVFFLSNEDETHPRDGDVGGDHTADDNGTEPCDEDDEEEDDDDDLQSPQNRQQQQQQQQQIMPLPIPKPRIKMEWLDGIVFSEPDLNLLATLQPESTLAERRRFLKARKHCVKAASAQLGTYLQWRETNRVNEFFPSTFTTDENDWTLAARGAVEISNVSGGPAPTSQMRLPRLVSIFEDDRVTCKNGARVVHVLPCQLDSNLATPSTYALAVAMYLDRKLDRNYTEKVTVVIDIRSGLGWTNPSSVSIVPFIKLVVGLLNSYFPERLSRCILFPLPRTATMLFNTAKTYLDPDTAAKIQVCAGTGSRTAPVPKEVLSFIDQRAIDIMEKRRKSFFIYT